MPSYWTKCLSFWTLKFFSECNSFKCQSSLRCWLNFVWIWNQTMFDFEICPCEWNVNFVEYRWIWLSHHECFKVKVCSTRMIWHVWIVTRFPNLFTCLIMHYDIIKNDISCYHVMLGLWGGQLKNWCMLEKVFVMIKDAINLSFARNQSPLKKGERENKQILWRYYLPVKLLLSEMNVFWHQSPNLLISLESKSYLFINLAYLKSWFV